MYFWTKGEPILWGLFLPSWGFSFGPLLYLFIFTDQWWHQLLFCSVWRNNSHSEQTWLIGQALQPATVYNSENYLHLKEHVQETPAVRNQRFFGYFDINGDGKISAIEVYFYALSMTLLHDHEKVIHTTSSKILEQVLFISLTIIDWSKKKYCHTFDLKSWTSTKMNELIFYYRSDLLMPN